MKTTVLSLLLIFSICAWAQEAKSDKTGKSKSSAPAKASAKTASPAGDAATEAAIKKMERELWDSWKNHDNKAFANYLADDAFVLDDPSAGFQDKKTMLAKMNGPQCDVKSYSFSDDRLTWVDKDAATYTYTATVDATCGGQKIPEKVYCSSVWAKRGTKWVGLLHQETPAMTPPAQ
jgi:ketosteroid isomerase-like protein